MDPDRYENVREALINGLESIKDEKGNPLNTRVIKPDDIYQETNRIAPDLMVYFGNLFWRSVGSVGLKTIHTFENDTGPDDANHAEEGIFIMHNPMSKENGKEIKGITLMDIAPTILQIMGINTVKMEGRSYA